MKYASILALAVAALSAGPAYAGCAQWDASGSALMLSQSNGPTLNFNVQQNGQDLSGRAQFISHSPNSFLGIELVSDLDVNTGWVEGTLKGNRAEFQVRWGNTVGVYSLVIDEDGRFTGETYDFQDPRKRAQVLGATKLRCVQAEAPPPPAGPRGVARRLGKGKPSPGPSPVIGRAESLELNRSATAILERAVSAASERLCLQGFVWREAGPNDSICVPPESRSRAAAENARAQSLWTDGAYGPKTCLAGFVWREAFSGDTVCVTPEVRELVRRENQLGSSRLAP